MLSQEKTNLGQIGIIIVTHLDYGNALLRTAEHILGPVNDCTSIQVDATLAVEETVTRLKEAVSILNTSGCGVLILTDMFGGTPTNLSLSLLGEREDIEVLTGVNLPMLLRVLSNRKKIPLGELVELAREAGCEGIIAARNILRSKPENK